MRYTFIRFNFKNGTDDPSYNTYGIMGSPSGDIPVQTFMNNLSPIGVETIQEWCAMCGNNNSRGCQFLQENANVGTEGLRWGGSVSPVGAGLLGAGLMVVVVGILATVGAILGLLCVGKGKTLRRASSESSSGGSGLVVRALEHCALTRATGLPLFNRMGPMKKCKSDNGKR